MKKFMKKLIKKAEGFTLVELIVVIAILGILAAVAVPAYSGYLTKANEAGDIVVLDAVKTAAQAAKAEDGAVTSVKLTITSKAITKVEVNVDGATADGALVYTALYNTAEDNDWVNSDFALFMNNTAPAALKSKAYGDAATLTWPDANGNWA